MGKTIKITGVRAAASKTRNYAFVSVVLDRGTGEVWATEYADDNGWTEYDNPDICVIARGGYGYGRNPLTMADIRAAALVALAKFGG